MADEPEEDILELGDDPEVQDEDPPVNDEVEEQPRDEEEDIELPTFADDGEDEPSDTDLVKHLRAELRKAQAEKKALEQGPKAEPPVVVGDKPTLESCDYDEEKFESELDAWKDRKRQAEEQANRGKEAQRAADEQWEQEKAAFAKKRAQLPYKDIDDVEAVVASTLDPAQIAMIVKVANDGPKLIYALGKNPSKLSALSSVKDPIKFIAAAVRLEAEVKMTKRRPTVEPDKITRGSAPLSTGSADAQMEKLEKEAARTGDRSKLIAYRAAKRAA